MTAQKTPEGWRVSNDRPSAGALAPWEYKTYKARTSTHFLALAPKSMKVGGLMTDLEKGLRPDEARAARGQGAEARAGDRRPQRTPTRGR